jgi:hypothetical protein
MTMDKRTVQALYESETEAAQARQQLADAGFHHVEIVGAHVPGALVQALERLAGMADHWHGEVKRGCVMLVAHVDAMRLTECAEIVDATSLHQIVHEA